MVNEIDLFNLEDPNSIIRKIINGEEEIILAEIAQRKVSIPIGYELKELHLKSGNGKEINSLINEEIKKFKEAGYPENIYTPIYEAILNAYQHGNKRDPNKKIIFAHKIGETSLDIIVEDEGGVIEGVFVPFILKHDIDIFVEDRDKYIRALQEYTQIIVVKKLWNQHLWDEFPCINHVTELPEKLRVLAWI